jgi:hypothetical protein
MPKIFSQIPIYKVFAMMLLGGSAAAAQQMPASVPPAPVPPQILAAKKVFISNVPGTLYYSPRNAEDDPYRPYNQFYDSMKAWGNYELVAAPSEADLILEVSLADRLTMSNATVQGSVRAAYFIVVMRDPKTQTVLWWLSERLQGANRISTGEKNYNQAMMNLINDMKKLVEASPTTGSSQK